MLQQEMEEQHTNEAEEITDQQHSEAPEQDEQVMFLSVHALGQQLVVPTPTVPLYINGKRAIALLDSGNTTSFINEDFAVKAKCNILPVKPRAIAITGGGQLLSSAVIPKCEFQLAKLKLQHNFRTLALPSHDVILGYDWFTTVSPIAFDIPKQTFSFIAEGKQTVTTAIYNSPETTKEVPAEEMHKLLDKGVEVFLLQVHNLLMEAPEGTKTPPQIQKLLLEYADLFEEPYELPPHRVPDHTIPLVPGVTPPQVRPYRVPQNQKKEMEEQIKILLATHLITHS